MDMLGLVKDIKIDFICFNTLEVFSRKCQIMHMTHVICICELL